MMTTAAAQHAGPSCPKCGSEMFDNRASKRNPKAPDYKCKNRSCDGVLWPPRGPQRPQAAPAPTRQGFDIPPAGSMPFDEAPIQPPGDVGPAENGSTARFNRLAALQKACFRNALTLAAEANNAGVPVTLEGVSALSATLMIAYKEGR